MDNPSRSERTRKAVLQAALTIIARDGPRQLTFDAIATESGISKGGVMHQFPNKAAVLKGLLEHQIQFFEEFSQNRLVSQPKDKKDSQLKAQIETLREVISDPHSVALGMLAAFVEDPSLLAIVRDSTAGKLQQLLANAEDRDMAMIRWAAARGLVISSLVGLCPLTDTDRQHLFDCLLDEDRWQTLKTEPRLTK